MHKPELGQIVGGKYRLLRELGRGGMATVFEAEHTLTLKRAAVKWLHPQFHDESGQGLQRVLREARAASRIRHENVVDVYDVVEEGSAVYLVMELLQGELLSQVLEREELPLHDLVALLVQAMRGVAAAHAAGVVHRDVKPDNIFLAREERERPVAKVIDFGISKLAEADPSNATRSGITMGTPRYASYEQLLGARQVDARTDVYAFGVILYEALTGRAPYGDAITFAEQAVRFATREALPVRTLREETPEPLEQLVQRAIAKHRDERTPSLEELLLQLVPFADPGKYPQPMLVRSQRGAPQRATLPQRRVEAQVAPARASEVPPHAEVELAGGAELTHTRRRGLALTALGVATMAFAVLAMRFEAPPHTRAARMTEPEASQGLLAPREPERVQDAGMVTAPTPAEPAAVEAPRAPVVTPALAVRRLRHSEARSLSARDPDADARTTSAHEPAAAPEARHRAGPLRRSEF